MTIQMLYLKGCPHHARATALVREVLHKERKRVDIKEIEVSTPEQAQSLAFLGSPTIRIDGLDVEPEARRINVFGLGCRTYFTETGCSGIPSEAMIRRAIQEPGRVAQNPGDSRTSSRSSGKRFALPSTSPNSA